MSHIGEYNIEPDTVKLGIVERTCQVQVYIEVNLWVTLRANNAIRENEQKKKNVWVERKDGEGTELDTTKNKAINDIGYKM